MNESPQSHRAEDGDLAVLVAELLVEVKALRLENARIIQQLEDEATVTRRLGVQDGDRHRLLKTSEIAFITTNERGLSVQTTDGETYINFDSIAEVEKRFAYDPRLLKVHKSFIVNLNQVRTVVNTAGGRNLTFYHWPDTTLVPVAYTAVPDFEKRLGIEGEG